jgi:hypothetical protein
MKLSMLQVWNHVLKQIRLILLSSADLLFCEEMEMPKFDVYMITKSLLCKAEVKAEAQEPQSGSSRKPPLAA